MKIIDRLYPVLDIKLFFPLGELFLKSSILSDYEFLMKTDWCTREELDNLQNQLLRNLIKHCYEKVPYYRELLDSLKLKPENIQTKEDLLKLPILTKKIIRENFDKLISIDYEKRKTKIHSTGGSTGTPLQFLTDLKTWSMSWAATLRAWNWYGFNLGEKIFTLAGNSLVSKKKLITKNKIFNKYLFRNFKFNSYGMKETDMEIYYKNFMKIKPSAIRGYPSSIYIFAKYIQDNRLKIYPVKMILTTGEVLLSEYRSKIQEVFQAPVFDNYGAGDGGIATHECYMHEGLHIAEEKAIIQICDKEGRLLKDGEIGNVIVTDLHNYVFPFIRYEVGDFAVMKRGFCSCGRKSKLLGEVLGRSGRLLYNKNGEPISPTMLPVLLYPYLDYESYENQVTYNKIDKFQIQQDEKGDLSILLKMKKKEDEIFEKYSYVIENYEKVFVNSKINLFFVDEIPPLPSGKEDYVVSNFNIFGD